VLYFFFSVILSFFGFWSNETWGVRFIFSQLVSFLSGAIFPLDMLPKPIFQAFQLLPFPYLLFFPLKIYMGKLTSYEIMTGLLIMVFWIQALYLIAYAIWRKGIRVYTAHGS
jgi:ABC-2 type transport system permease protein